MLAIPLFHPCAQQLLCDRRRTTFYDLILSLHLLYFLLLWLELGPMFALRRPAIKEFVGP